MAAAVMLRYTPIGGDRSDACVVSRIIRIAQCPLLGMEECREIFFDNGTAVVVKESVDLLAKRCVELTFPY